MNNNPLAITNINLAAMLAACGVNLFTYEDGSPPFIKLQTERGVTYTFFFEPTQEAFDIAEAFRNELFAEQNPDHPWAYVLAFIANRKTLMDVVNQSAGLAMIQKGGRTALISTNAPESVKSEILKRL